MGAESDRPPQHRLPEVAEIDRDREIVATLIHVAGHLLCTEKSSTHPNELADAQAEAFTFLKAWFGRKKPPFEMPKL